MEIAWPKFVLHRNVTKLHFREKSNLSAVLENFNARSWSGMRAYHDQSLIDEFQRRGIDTSAVYDDKAISFARSVKYDLLDNKLVLISWHLINNKKHSVPAVCSLQGTECNSIIHIPRRLHQAAMVLTLLSPVVAGLLYISSCPQWFLCFISCWVITEYLRKYLRFA